MSWQEASIGFCRRSDDDISVYYPFTYPSKGFFIVLMTIRAISSQVYEKNMTYVFPSSRTLQCLSLPLLSARRRQV